MEGKNGFRKDDIEAFGYCVMFLTDNREIPWFDVTDSNDSLRLKESFSTDANLQKFQGIQIFIQRCIALKYDQEPDYSALENDLKNMFFD